jgi:hypothetical protein
MERRVTASTKAKARAARPMSEAPTTDELSGRALTSATGRPRTPLPAVEPGDGWSVGKRLAALPPGLRLGLVPAVTPGRSPTDSGDVVVIGVIVVCGVGVVLGVAVAVDGGDVDADADELAAVGAETRAVADAVGSWARPEAVPTTVSVTDVTDDAAGTAIWAWS